MIIKFKVLSSLNNQVTFCKRTSWMPELSPLGHITSRDQTGKKIRRVLKERSQVEIFSTWVKKNIFSGKPSTETELIDETNSSTVSDT